MGFHSIPFHLGISAPAAEAPPNVGFHSIPFYFGISAPAVFKTAVLPIFDLRMSSIALQTSNGKAIGDTDLGTISYVYNDMKNNNGDITLPYG